MKSNLSPGNRTDIDDADWVDRWLPGRAVPFARLMRLDRPIGTWLLLFPCWWSMTLAGDIAQVLVLHGLFAVGAVVMRGAGCTINDMWDRDIDAQVERTRSRPIASGALSMGTAWVFLAAQLSVGLLILVQLSPAAIGLGVASLALVATYPLAKRITWWPQAFLGLTFNWGVLMGWAAVTGTLDWPAAILYAACLAWTIGYDTIYAHQDKVDDALVGVKSTARLFGRHSRRLIGLFYALAAAGFAGALAAAEAPWPAWLGWAGVVAHFAWQVRTADFDDPVRCRRHFQSNRWVGWIFWLGLVAGDLI